MSTKEQEDQKYMKRCIQLALNGQNNVAPNPMVGAVIVHNHKIIGEGYHIQCGKAHAEVNAINSVKNKKLLKEATIYVSLEPCSHYGKTPPCVDLIIKHNIPRVVVGCLDPFPKVSGRGIQKLKDAKIEVTVGVLEKECKELNKIFITFNRFKRPYIVLKCAESADGFIDKRRESGNPVVLSTPQTAILVHKKRADYKSIMVGTNTARLDNPKLNTRLWHGKNPIRIVLDRTLKLSKELHLFDHSIQTIVFTEKETKNEENIEYITINFEGQMLEKICFHLYQRKIQSVLIEGGKKLLQSFIDKGLWDEAYIEKSDILIEDGIPTVEINCHKTLTIENHFSREVWHYKNC